MTLTEAQEMQQWRGMSGATAFHLIERHADSWEDIDMLMTAWCLANQDLTLARILAESERAS